MRYDETWLKNYLNTVRGIDLADCLWFTSLDQYFLRKWYQEAPPRGFLISNYRDIIDLLHWRLHIISSHPSRKETIEIGLSIARDIYGPTNKVPTLKPEWQTPLIHAMFGDVECPRPIIADELQNQGCEESSILEHLRDVGVKHYERCWVKDLVLGRYLE